MRRRTVVLVLLTACGGAPAGRPSSPSTAPRTAHAETTSKGSTPGDSASVTVPAALPRAAPLVTQIAAMGDTTCARLADASIRCWGDNQYNVVALVAMDEQYVPRPTAIAELGPANKVVVGAAHACALLENGDVKCWGSDDGALGIGTPLPPGPPPFTPRPAAVLGLHGVVDLAGAGHLCAKLGSGAVSCWHDYDSGVGDPRDAGSRTPVIVPAFAHAVQLVTGGSISCALFADGKAKCSRDVSPGLIPRGKVRLDPIEVPGLGEVTALSAGNSGVCGITKKKTVRCWGNFAFEHPSESSPKTPAYAVASLKDVSSVALGDDMGCAIVGSGDVVCEHEDYSKPHIPIKVAGVSGAVEIAVGSGHACARTAAGAMLCWGRDDKGQLGDDGKTDRAEAVPVAF
ncbi:MAG: hypothetical protein ABI551_00985 [Polyangiaceae bacterium]